MTIGVAISTTGDEHRLGFLETCVAHWCKIEADMKLFVTVDGDLDAVARVTEAVAEYTGSVFRVGRPRFSGDMGDQHRLGVATNKNTGLEILMDSMVNHVFLCDDDTWPLNDEALALHMGMDDPHSMVNWGMHRLRPNGWTWPRGALLYVRPQVLAQVGGMDERFGAGGHEHVEWSRRIHQKGLTSKPYPAPRVYRERGGMGAAPYWHAEDMRKVGEPIGNLRARRRSITSVRRPEQWWENAEAIMAERDGHPDYVPFRAAENGRASATIPTRSA